MPLLWICAAGALGTGARALLSAAMLRALGPAFPWGTLTVNLLGAFLMGLAMQVAAARPELPATVRLTVTTGFLGGFTTYSAFNQDTLRLLQDGSHAAAAGNVLGTVLGALVAGALGMWAARAGGIG